MSYYDCLLLGFPASRLSHSNLFLIFLNIKLIMSPSCLALPLIPHYLQTLIQLPLLSLREPSRVSAPVSSPAIFPATHLPRWSLSFDVEPVLFFVFLFFFFCRGRALGMWESYFPDQLSNPCPLQWNCGVLTAGVFSRSVVSNSL